MIYRVDIAKSVGNRERVLFGVSSLSAARDLNQIILSNCFNEIGTISPKSPGQKQQQQFELKNSFKDFSC